MVKLKRCYVFFFVKVGVVIIILIMVFKNWLVLKCLVLEIFIRIGKKMYGVVDIMLIIFFSFLMVGNIWMIDFGLNRFWEIKMLFKVINRFLVIRVGMIGMKMFDSNLMKVIMGLNFWFLVVICFKFLVEIFLSLVCLISLL